MALSVLTDFVQIMIKNERMWFSEIDLSGSKLYNGWNVDRIVFKWFIRDSKTLFDFSDFMLIFHEKYKISRYFGETLT